MKIREEHFKSLKHVVVLTEKEILSSNPDLKEKYKEHGFTPKRYRWDLLAASLFITSILYTYLNDNHIDTALKAITNTKEEW